MVDRFELVEHGIMWLLFCMQKASYLGILG